MFAKLQNLQENTCTRASFSINLKAQKFIKIQKKTPAFECPFNKVAG